MEDGRLVKQTAAARLMVDFQQMAAFVDTFWLVAASFVAMLPLLLFIRRGRPGDTAPDFSLRKLDKTETVRLAELNKNQPVVMVFGSYT